MNYVTPSKGNVAIIGFSKKVPLKNRYLAFVAGCQLTFRGFNISAGNTIGTFIYAFLGAKLFHGKTFAITQPNFPSINDYFIDRTLIIKHQHAKHEYIACCSSAALVIGGGEQSISLIQEFLDRGKPVIAVKETQGIVRYEVQNYGIEVTDLSTAINWIEKSLTEA